MLSRWDVVLVDEDLIKRLPLPLAQICRRAQNAKSALEQHQAAYYFWEVSLKLLASTAVVEYAELKDDDPQLAERLQNLARPAIGHWWEFARRLVPILADRGDEGFAAIRDLMFTRARSDMPRCTGLDAALREAVEQQEGSRSTVRLTEMFNRLVQYRNQELGHGASGQKPRAFYEKMSASLLGGMGELFGRLDVLAGRRLVYVADVRRQSSGQWIIERLELVGDSARRIESLEVGAEGVPFLPRPDLVYLEKPSGESSLGLPALRSLHPLVFFKHDSGEVFFLNSQRGKKQADFLCYNTGQVIKREVFGPEQRELFARIFGSAPDGASVETWSAK